MCVRCTTITLKFPALPLSASLSSATVLLILLPYSRLPTPNQLPSYWISAPDGGTSSDNARRVLCVNGVAVSGDGTSAENPAVNCTFVTNTFEEALYDDNGNPARFWQPLAPTVNVALKNSFMGIGGAF